MTLKESIDRILNSEQLRQKLIDDLIRREDAFAMNAIERGFAQVEFFSVPLSNKRTLDVKGMSNSDDTEFSFEIVDEEGLLIEHYWYDSMQTGIERCMHEFPNDEKAIWHAYLRYVSGNENV